jgi:hypothetical protein
MFSNALKSVGLIFFIHTMCLCTKTTTKSPTSIASILLPQATKDTPTIDTDAKDEDKEAILHLEKSLKSMSHMIHSKKKGARHIIRDIPNLFACLEDDSKIEDCCKIDNFKYIFL